MGDVNLMRRSWTMAAPRAIEHTDLPALSRFLIRAYNFDPSDHHADPQLLAWKYLYPRPGWQGGRSYVLERNGQIVAHCGVCPATFHLPDGKIVDSLTTLDWAADASYPGVGIVLMRKLMAMAPTSFIIGAAPVTRKIAPSIGYQHVGDARTYAAWLRPWREFRRRLRTPRSALRLGHGLFHPVTPLRSSEAVWDAILMNEFDDSLLPILNNTKRPWTFCQRTLADLNYLLKCPLFKVQGFLLRRQGQLAGYFIAGRADWEARLFELSVDSTEANDWNLACATVTRTVQLDPEVCRVRVYAALPILGQALLRNGYWCQYKDPIMVYDPTHALAGAFPVNFQLFAGDSGY